MRAIASIVAGVVILLLIVSTFFGSWYTIDTTERGVLLNNGAIASNVPIEPGLHWKMPFVQSVDTISIQTNSVEFKNVQAYSYDQQVAKVKLSVNYHIAAADVITVRQDYITTENMVQRVLWTKVPTIFKNVMGAYTAQTSIQERAKLGTDFYAALVAGIHAPIQIDSVQIEDISFSDAFDQANEQKQLADVAVQQLMQKAKQAEVSAQITVTNAKAAADAQIATATANAQAIKLNGDAEAGVIQARGQALKDNPGVTALIQAEKWDGHLPTTMPPNSTVPFLNLGSN